MIVGRVIVGVTETVDDFNRPLPFLNEEGDAIDTFHNATKTEFVKLCPNEVYPNFVLVYRDLNGDGDFRSSRITDVVKRCQISYRAGTRFNPEEAIFQKGDRRPATQQPKSSKRRTGNENYPAHMVQFSIFRRFAFDGDGSRSQENESSKREKSDTKRRRSPTEEENRPEGGRRRHEQKGTFSIE